MLTYGFFGANVREALMLGKPVVCYLRAEWLEQMRAEVPGYVEELPVVSATPDTVERVLRDLIADPERRREIGRRSREFALKWHSAEVGGRALRRDLLRARRGRAGFEVLPVSDARVSLEPLREEDSEPLFAWINDRELVVLNAPFAPVDRAAHDAWFDRIRAADDVEIFGIRIERRPADRLVPAQRDRPRGRQRPAPDPDRRPLDVGQGPRDRGGARSAAPRRSASSV